MLCNFISFVVYLIIWQDPYYAIPAPDSTLEAIRAEPGNHHEPVPESSLPFDTLPVCDFEAMYRESSSDAEFLADDESANESANQTQRLQPATLSLLGNSAFGAERITAGNRWVKVSYQPFNFNLILPLATNPDAVRFWLNGLPADPEMLTLSSFWAAIDRRTVSADFQWQCPSLGKVVLQAEYLIDGTWGPLSRPLRIEIMPPPTPQPIAAGATETGLILIANPVQAIECLNSVVVKFANLTPGASVVADIAGIGHVQGSDQQNCCYFFDLKSTLPVGRYKITFRQIDSNHCGLSSRSSTPIVVDLSYDPYAEVAIDTTKSFRRRELLKFSESLIHESKDQEIESMKQSLRDPCPTPMKPDSVPATAPAAPSIQRKSITSRQKTERTQLSKDNVRNTKLEKAISSHGPQSPTDNKVVYSDLESHCSQIMATGQQWSERMKQAYSLSLSMESMESSQDSIKSSFQTSKFVSKIDFDTPTVFACGRKLYSSDGAVAGDLTILEGMRISAAANGTYRVEFKYIAPRTPAILHLQIQIRSDETSGWKTLTLAPIVIKPINYDEPDTMVHQVVREGYSSALERVGGYIDQARRRGSAVSGYNFSGSMESGQF